MQTITKIINVYEFDELSKEAQAKAIEHFRDIDTNDSWWSDGYIEEHIVPKLEASGFIKPEVVFGGFGSQGDGASFTCEDIDIGKLGKALNYPQGDVDIIAEAVAVDNAQAGIQRHSGREVHEMSCKFDIDVDWSMQSEQEAESLAVICDLFTEKAEAHRYNLCKEAYKALEDEYNELTSDAHVAEYLNENSLAYQFLEDGTYYND